MNSICLLFVAMSLMAQPAGRSGITSPVSRNKPVLPRELHGIGITQKLNALVPLQVLFKDEKGETLPLRSFFKGKPVLLIPVYYTCPMLCNQILRAVVAGLRPLTIKPGRDFEIVAFSINPGDTPADAARKHTEYSQSYSSRAGTAGWHFLTGSRQSIDALANAIGFQYRWDSKAQMFIHASGVMVITPEGRIARYLYGVEYQPKDLKLSLVEASHNFIGSPVDQVLLFCYHYDSASGKYGLVVMDILRATGVLAFAIGALAIIFLWKKDLREHSAGSRRPPAKVSPV